MAVALCTLDHSLKCAQNGESTGVAIAGAELDPSTRLMVTDEAGTHVFAFLTLGTGGRLLHAWKITENGHRVCYPDAREAISATFNHDPAKLKRIGFRWVVHYIERTGNAHAIVRLPLPTPQMPPAVWYAVDRLMTRKSLTPLASYVRSQWESPMGEYVTKPRIRTFGNATIIIDDLATLDACKRALDGALEPSHWLHENTRVTDVRVTLLDALDRAIDAAMQR